MKLNSIKRIVMAKPKGAFSHLMWEKQLPVRKSFGNMVVTKRTHGIVRTGISYNNMASVKSKRENGLLPEQPQQLSWGQWLSYPYFIGHKGNVYLRVSLDSHNKLESEYFINGMKATKEQAKMYCLKSAFPENENIPDVLTINTENIIAIK